MSNLAQTILSALKSQRSQLDNAIYWAHRDGLSLVKIFEMDKRRKALTEDILHLENQIMVANDARIRDEMGVLA